MATIINVTSGNGELGALEDWSVQDDATPTIVGSGGGSVGNINAQAKAVAASQYLNNGNITISDPDLGDYLGTVDSVSVKKDTVSLTGGGLLNVLNIEVNAPAIYGTQTLSDAYTTYIGLCFTTPPSISYTAASNPVVAYAAWSGNAWDYIRNLAAATKTEVAVINGVIIIRDVGAVTMEIPNTIDITLNPDSQDTAKTVEIVSQRTTTVNSTGANLYNYVLNPSVETNATDWANNLIIGTATTSPVRSTTVSYSGTASYRGVYSTALSFGTNRLTVGYSTATGTIPYTTDPVYFSVAARVGFTVTAGMYISVEPTLGWYDSSGVATGPVTSLGQWAMINGSWRQFVSSGVSMPANAVTAKIGITLRALPTGVGTAMTGITFAADAAIVSPQTSAFFDGNTATASWTGTTNNSISFMANPNNVSMYNAFDDNNNIITVAAGEVSSVDLTTTNSPSILAPLQPTNGTSVIPGQYIVSGADDLPIVASQWLAYGGSVTAIISSKPNTIELIVTGPTINIPGAAGPYSLSISDGTNQYAMLNIAGAGVLVAPVTFTLQTGASNTQNEVGTTIDIPFIITDAQARTAGSEVAMYYGGNNITIEFELAAEATEGFGLAVGSMVKWNDNNFRVTSCNFNNATVRIIAVARPTGTDWNTIWTGKTGVHWNTVWGAKAYTGSDYTVTPMKAS